MIENFTSEQLAQRIQIYQQQHKETAEALLKDQGQLVPPFLTVLGYVKEVNDFKQFNIEIHPLFFRNSDTKTLFIQEFLPMNLQKMLENGITPTALSISMEANMRMGTPGESVDKIMSMEPQEIIMHSFETLTTSTAEIFKILKSDTKVVNEDGDIIDDITLELVNPGKDGETPQVEGPFANILQKFSAKVTS